MERKEPKKNVHVHMANVILQIHKITQQKPFFSTDPQCPFALFILGAGQVRRPEPAA